MPDPDFLLPVEEYKSPENVVRITFGGDTYFGEFYQQKREKEGKNLYLKKYLAEEGYDYFGRKIANHLQDSDYVIANLECVLTDKDYSESPYSGEKGFILGGDPELTIAALKNLNVQAVSLANNHSADFGAEDLEKTVNYLKDANIVPFGAGANKEQAQAALKVELSCGEQTFKLAVISAYEFVRLYADKFKPYADDDQWGVNDLHPKRLLFQIEELKKQGYYVVVQPHWGANYSYAHYGQMMMADMVLGQCEADLMLGHGPHIFTDVHKRKDRWVFYSIGNLIFCNQGEHEDYAVPPYSALVDLIIEPGQGDSVSKALHIYPLHTDNHQTEFQSRFVTAEEFDLFCGYLFCKQFDVPAMVSSFKRLVQDGRFFLRLDL